MKRGDLESPVFVHCKLQARKAGRAFRGLILWLSLFLKSTHSCCFLFAVRFLCFRQIQTKAELKIFDLRYLDLLALVTVTFRIFVLMDC